MDLSDVRKNIDRVDGEIRKLFIERMQLADEVACIKAKTADVIFKRDREEAIIAKQSAGMSPRLVKEYTAFIKRIMAVSRKYQYGRTMELRDCFPFAYETKKRDIAHLAMLKKELYACSSFSKDLVVTVDSYEELAQKLQAGEVEAGMGIIEEIGVNVSDELHHLLYEKQLYINECQIQEEKEVQRKVVTFGNTLVVLPEHNRVKLVFQCPNVDGSLSGILSMISDYSVNLTEIHSRPFRDGDTWNYLFFAELDANMDTKEIRALLFQLSQETEWLRVLGSYRCDHV